MPYHSKRTRNLNRYNKERKRQTLTAQKPTPAVRPQQRQDSNWESEVEEDVMTIPNLPALEDDHEGETNAFTEMISKGLHSQPIHFPYQRSMKPSRQALWRQKKEAEALKSASVGCLDIASMFAGVPSRPVPTEPPLATKHIPRNLEKDIQDLETFVGYKRATTCFFNDLNTQTRARHQAVLHFLYSQAKNKKGATRKQLALDVAISFNRGAYFSKRLISWERAWCRDRAIPHGHTGCHRKTSSLFDDEEVQLFVMEYVSSKKEAIVSSSFANAVTEFVGSKELGKRVSQAIEEGERLPEQKQGIKARTAQQWLKSMGYTWRRAQKGLYVDGHERADVVKYRQEVFIPAFNKIRPRLAKWDENGDLDCDGLPPEGNRWVIIVTHDESTFHANDGRRDMWLPGMHNPLVPKTIGKGIMVSEFLTPGRRLQVPDTITDAELQEKSLRRFATEILEYGKDNYWSAEKMVEQTLNVAIPIFELAFPADRFQALFLFDNATNHKVMAPDALNARRMNLYAGGKQPVMRDGWNSMTGAPQSMNDANGIPKGIKRVLEERGLWPAEGLRLSCETNSHKDTNDCCARRLLGSQPDFQAQKGVLVLQEEIEQKVHLVLFYPKFHPELNFIEYFWGYGKRFARENCDYTFAGLRNIVWRALEAVPKSTIRKYHQKSLRILDTYRDGHKFGTPEFTKCMQRYKSHRWVGAGEVENE